MKSLALSVVLLSGFGPQAGVPADDPELSVQAELVDGELLCSVTASGLAVHRVVRELATEVGLQVEGFDPLVRASLVTVELRQRPLGEVLEFVLGSVGLDYDLRPGVLTIREGRAKTAPPSQLRDLAMVAYLRATDAFPHHPLGARARMSQGRIEENRGNDAAALAHYEYVLETYRTSPEHPNARYRAALALERLGLFADANQQFRILANLDLQHGYESEAWIGMARTTNALGDPQGALRTLDALEVNVPPVSIGDRRERLLERVRALNGLDRFDLALETLDEIDQLGLTAAETAESFGLRGVTFEGLGLLAEAGRAWLVFAREVDGPDRGRALENAARLALADADELAALLVCEEARSLGFAERLRPYEIEARNRLGLYVAIDPLEVPPSQRLDLAESWLDEGRIGKASHAVETLFEVRGQLDEEGLARVWRLRARILNATSDLGAALDLLRAARSQLLDAEHRALLDATAAGFFEQLGRFEDAVEAYGGRY